MQHAAKVEWASELIKAPLHLYYNYLASLSNEFTALYFVFHIVS